MNPMCMIFWSDINTKLRYHTLNYKVLNTLIYMSPFNIWTFQEFPETQLVKQFDLYLFPKGLGSGPSTETQSFFFHLQRPPEIEQKW